MILLAPFSTHFWVVILPQLLSTKPTSTFFTGEALFAKGDREEAELWYKKSLHSKADHVPAFMALAKLFSKTERVKEAEKLYHEALKLEPRNMDVYIHYCK